MEKQETLGQRVCRCRKCGHEWVRRAGGGLPARCPAAGCRTLLWARERRPNGGERRARWKADGGYDFGA